jgi:hypothetical protein
MVQDLTQAESERLDQELRRYGLEEMEGNRVSVLLRHIQGSRAMVEAAMDGTIELLEAKLRACVAERAKMQGNK